MKSTSTACSTPKKTRKARVCRIHVSQPAIRQNLKALREGGNSYAPVITTKRGKENIYGHAVNIFDKDGNLVATVMQPEDKTLSCGARVWIETYNAVEVVEHKEDHDLITYLEV
jgi:hypothetical protein